MKRPVVSPAFLPLVPPSSYTLQEESFDSQNSWSASDKWDMQKRKVRSDWAAKEAQLTSGCRRPPLYWRDPPVPRKQSGGISPQQFREICFTGDCWCCSSLRKSCSRFHLGNPATILSLLLWPLRHQLLSRIEKRLTSGRNFKVVASNKLYFLISLETYRMQLFSQP